MKVALYCRVSTEEQHPEHQEKELIRYCKEKKYSVYKIYTDKFSGTKSSRPKLDKLISDSNNNNFEALIVWKLDRLGRSLQDLIKTLNILNNNKISFICTTQQIDTTTSHGKFLFHILGAVAEFESNIISERTKLGLKGKRKGRKVGARDKKPRSKYGYLKRYRKDFQIQEN